MAGKPRLERTNVPGVYKRGSRYTFVYRDAQGDQRWGTADTKSEARRLKIQFEAQPALLTSGDWARRAFGEYARHWIDTYAGRTSAGVRSSTIASYRAHLENRTIPYFDEKVPRKLGEITATDIKAYVSWLGTEPSLKDPSRQLSLSTIRRNFAPLRALFADAVEDRILPFSPAAHVKVVIRDSGARKLESDDAVVRAMTSTELIRLQFELDTQWRLMVDFLIRTGLRFGELAELRWFDLDLGAPATVAVIRQWDGEKVAAPKSENGVRTLPLSARMAAALAERRGAPQDLVFKAPKGGRLDNSNLRASVLVPARTRAGLEWVTFHTMRHTCASLLFKSGKDLKQVQKWLGHHSPAFTLERYVHLMDEGLGDAEDLEDFLPGSDEGSPEGDGDDFRGTDGPR